MVKSALQAMMVLTAFCVAVSALATERGVESSPEAESMVRQFSAGLLDIMKRGDALGLEGRANTIAPVVRSCFDLTAMARATVGRAWTGLSPEDRQRWVRTFTDDTIYRLATRFSDFDGQSFEILGQRSASRGTLVVKTMLRRPAEEDVRLDYRVREEETGWKVIDIYARGTISEVAVRRSEYSKVLRDDGINALIDSVSAMTEKRLAGD